MFPNSQLIHYAIIHNKGFNNLWKIYVKVTDLEKRSETLLQKLFKICRELIDENYNQQKNIHRCILTYFKFSSDRSDKIFSLMEVN